MVVARTHRLPHMWGLPAVASHGYYYLCMNISEPRAESLSQHELRNESGRVLRAVSEGHSFVLTNSGVSVGRIAPLDAPGVTDTR